MNIGLSINTSLGKAKNFILSQILSTVINQQGHQFKIDVKDAELIIIVGKELPLDINLINKKVYVVDPEAALLAPEQTILDGIQYAEHYTYTNNIELQNKANVKKVIAVTACPTGVAHTFMSAEAIEKYCLQQGWQIKVETRGQVGVGSELSQQDIAEADLVFVAADIDVDLSKFNGKKLYRTSTSLALKKTAQEFDRAWRDASIYQHSLTIDTQNNKMEKKGIYSHLMTGVSYMLPMVVAGGLIIALSFVFGIEAFKQKGTLAAALMEIGGGSAFGLIIPILSGYIAYSVADRPGLTPGLVGGMLASSLGTGFLGGIISGFLAGYVANLLTDKIKLPATMTALKPILIIPFFSTLIVGLVMLYVVGNPVAGITKSMTNFLTHMQSGSAILLGIILGAMMCFDMGGPVNKAAYTFGVGLLASASYLPMAAVMAAGMVPALGMGVATFLAKNKFDQNEREGGKASFILGLCFISEGAIPFAARDPMRVIPSCMLGGAITGALSMFFGVKLMAPHGGIFVLAIPGAVSPVLPYLIAIVVGSLVTGILYAVIKSSK